MDTVFRKNFQQFCLIVPLKHKLHDCSFPIIRTAGKNQFFQVKHSNLILSISSLKDRPSDLFTGTRIKSIDFLDGLVLLRMLNEGGQTHTDTWRTGYVLAQNTTNVFPTIRPRSRIIQTSLSLHGFIRIHYCENHFLVQIIG